MKRSRTSIKLILALWLLGIWTPHAAQSAISCQALFSSPRTEAGPRLLSTIESKLASVAGPEATEIVVRRGLTLPNYKGEHLLQFLFGNWNYTIASHDFSKSYQAKRKQGLSSEQAAAQTAQQIYSEISAAVASHGYAAYTISQSRATFLGYKVEEKVANGMSAAPAPADMSKTAMTPTPFGYAFSGYSSIVSRKTLSPDSPMLVLDVRQKVPAEYKREGEIIIPSHIPPTKVETFYLGFSNWYNVREVDVPPQPTEQWFRFQIKKRDKSGRPAQIEVTKMTQVIDSIFESWIEQPEKWRTDSLNSKRNSDFERENPLLQSTLSELKALLSQ
jgi:hypothetical protein